MYKLSNGGSTWNSVTWQSSLRNEPSAYFQAVLIDNYNNAIYLANIKGFYYNNGIANNGLSNYYNSIYTLALAPNGTIYAGTSAGVYRTTNLGTNWYPSSNFNSSGTSIRGIAVIDNNIIFAAVANNGILRSMDGGINLDLRFTSYGF